MRKSLSLFPVLLILAGVFFTFSAPALADDDPPGRVARLNLIQGSISFQPGGESDWVQANPNRPLTTGDNLWADRDSRGEMHIGSSSIRIGSGTGITFLNLDDHTVQIQLAQGSLNVTVRRLDDDDDFEIDTPNLAFTLHRPGDYRVDVDADGNATTIAVRSGEGQATGGGSDYRMDSGDRATFTGTDSLNYDGGRIGRGDGFDAWCRSRDDREEHSRSARYVSRDVIGYDDLDDNGEWRSVPDYGTVWFPTHVAAGWAPYRYGHWVWVSPWGWTWVEDEPWGFAPFHYGRWAEVGGGWCWVPGPVVVRPVYSPALVVFVGGPRFGLSLSVGGGGGVGWFPLGPREVYVPPYRTSERYVQQVNVTNTTVNVTNVTNVYNNTTVNNVNYMHQHNVQAVTVVSHDTFVNARQVNTGIVRVNEQQMRGAEVQRNFTVAPVQRSVVGAGAAASVRPPAAVMQRQVVAVQTPPPPRASFNGVPQPQSRIIRQTGTMPQRGQQQQIQQQPPQQPQFRGQQPPAQQQGQPPMQQQRERGSQQQQIQQQPSQQQPQFRGQQPRQEQNQPPVQQQQRGQQHEQMQQQPSQQQPQFRGQQPRQEQNQPPVQQQQRGQQHEQMQQQPSQQQPQFRGQQPRQEQNQPPVQQQHGQQQEKMQQQPSQQQPQFHGQPPAQQQQRGQQQPQQQQNPNVRSAPPPQAAPPQRSERDQPRTQDHEQDSKKQGDQKDKK
jgi:hypothetical protein